MDCDVCADSACVRRGAARLRLGAKYGVELPQYCDKASAAVAETAGEILTYDGAPIEAVYFSCSGGSTEAAVARLGYRRAIFAGRGKSRRAGRAPL